MNTAVGVSRATSFFRIVDISKATAHNCPNGSLWGVTEIRLPYDRNRSAAS